MQHSHSAIALLGLLLAALAPTAALAQGQDSTTGERHLKIMAELLPGVYDNANQAYFDGRRKLPTEDRHARTSTTITRVEAPAFGRYAFLWVNRTDTPQGSVTSARIATLAAGPGSDEVTLRHYLRMSGEIRSDELATLRPGDLRRTEGCDYHFERRADHFRGLQRPKACRFDWEGQAVYTDNEISLSRDDLFVHDHKYRMSDGKRITGVASGDPYWLERARIFHCYADVPGVGGGGDIPFDRFDRFTLHDKGAVHWFRSPARPERGLESREIGLMLRAVTWHVLNESNDNFNRDSLVLSVMEKLADGSVKEHGYAFTDPMADRIAINLKWMLGNCALTPRDQARAEM